MSGHAVVIGGGIAGLLAAHALAGQFEGITVLERYSYPVGLGSPAPAPRRGVPQSRCVHLVMAAGAAAFEELMPGWKEELVALGASCFDASSDAMLRSSAGWLPRVPSSIVTYACSRVLLEHVLRRGFAGNTTVHIRENRKVVGLLGSPLGERVTGVRTAERRRAGETTLLADLVVDASGAGSQLPRWIASLTNGVGSQVATTLINCETQYVSRWFHIESREAPDWHCLSIGPTAGAALRSGMMLRAEEDHWGVVLQAPVGEPLPSSETTFLDFAAGLADGALREALARARPVSPIYRYGRISNRMTHYDRLPAWPAGLVTLGDSVCALDPYFGLGMTAAARGAALLRTYLRRQDGGAIHGFEFQKELAFLNTQAWRLATGRDPDGRLGGNVVQLGPLYEAALSNPEIAHALLAVQHLLRPAETLMEVAK